MPIDINILRKEKGGDPDKVRKSEIDRFTDDPKLVDTVIELDEKWVKCNYQMETAKMEFNKNNKEIADKKKASKGKDKCEDLVAKSGPLKAKIAELEVVAEDLKKESASITGPEVLKGFVPEILDTKVKKHWDKKDQKKKDQEVGS